MAQTPKKFLDADGLTYVLSSVINTIDEVKADKTDIDNTIGDLSNLNTTAKNNLVAAINEAATNNPVTSVNGQTGDVTVSAATDVQVQSAVSTWLSANVDPETGYVIDNSLTIQGAAADAKKTGDDIADLTDNVNNIKNTFYGSQLVPQDWSPSLTKGKYWKQSDGTEGSANTHCRTSNTWLGFNTRAAITLADDTYIYGVTLYDETNGYIGFLNYTTDTVYLPLNAYYFGVSIRRVDSAALTDADVTAIKAAFSVYTLTDKTVTLENYPADAKAVKDMISYGDTPNLFYTNATTGTNGIVITVEDDGTLDIHGTATSATYRTIMGASNRADYILPAGTYYIKMDVLSGTKQEATSNQFSLRIGDRSNGSLTGDDLVVSSSTPVAIPTYSTSKQASLYIPSGCQFEHYRVRFTIAKGSTIVPYIRHTSVTDYEARAYADRIKTLPSQMDQNYPVLLESGNYRGQGGTILGDNLFWIQNAATETDDQPNNLWQVNLNTGATSRYTSAGLTYGNSGHCNDMCYCPDDNCFYIACYSTTKGVVKVTRNPTVYNSNINPVDENGNAFAVTGICYNRLTQQFICVNNSGERRFYFYDAEWNYIKYITPVTALSNFENYVTQAIETDGHYIYWLVGRGSENTGYYGVIIVTTMDGANVEDYKLKHFDDATNIEAEGIAYDWSNGSFLCNVNVHGSELTQSVYGIVPSNMSFHCAGMTRLLLKRWANGRSF